MLPPELTKSNDHSLVENGSFKNLASTRLKVEQDIGFLNERIAALQLQAKPNQLLIDHYSSMLKSRESVLKWLLDGEDQLPASLRQDQFGV